jgi:hypothetical protein
MQDVHGSLLLLQQNSYIEYMKYDSNCSVNTLFLFWHEGSILQDQPHCSIQNYYPNPKKVLVQIWSCDFSVVNRIVHRRTDLHVLLDVKTLRYCIPLFLIGLNEFHTDVINHSSHDLIDVLLL